LAAASLPVRAHARRAANLLVARTITIYGAHTPGAPTNAAYTVGVNCWRASLFFGVFFLALNSGATRKALTSSRVAVKSPIQLSKNNSLTVSPSHVPFVPLFSLWSYFSHYPFHKKKSSPPVTMRKSR